MRIMTPSPPSARLALRSHPSLEEYGSLVKLLALDFRQLVPVDPFLAVHWVQFKPIVILTIYRLFATGRVVPHAAKLTSVPVHAVIPSSSAGMIVVCVNISRDRGASRAVGVAVPRRSRTSGGIVGVSRPRGLLDTLYVDCGSVQVFSLQCHPLFIAPHEAAFYARRKPTSLLRGTANSHFSFSTPPDEVRASVEYAVTTPAIPRTLRGSRRE